LCEVESDEARCTGYQYSSSSGVIQAMH
jgi:hypothetical protein